MRNAGARQIRDVLERARQVAEPVRYASATELEARVRALEALVRDLAASLQGWGDSKDDPALDSLLARADKEVGK